MRTRAERRHNDWTKAKRKKAISDAYSCFGFLHPWYDNLHQYSKNKIHCSCGMCSRYHKTKNKGHKRQIAGNYSPSYNPSMSDRRKDLHMQELEQEYLEIYNETLQGDYD